MPNIFCLLNHELTPKQTEELLSAFGAGSVTYPSEEISSMWSGIPTDRELKKSLFKPIIDWLEEARAGDVFLLQGEFSATFALADYALKKGLIPLCAVTKRVSREVQEGEKVHKNYVFEHICFRRYSYYNDLT